MGVAGNSANGVDDRKGLILQNETYPMERNVSDGRGLSCAQTGGKLPLVVLLPAEVGRKPLYGTFERWG